MAKKLTLEQLYGYSVMNWEQYLNKVMEANLSRVCSFCRDAEVGCLNCRLLDRICSDGGAKGLFKNITDTETKLYAQVNKIITELRDNYEKINKLDNGYPHKCDDKKVEEGA